MNLTLRNVYTKSWLHVSRQKFHSYVKGFGPTHSSKDFALTVFEGPDFSYSISSSTSHCGTWEDRESPHHLPLP